MKKHRTRIAALVLMLSLLAGILPTGATAAEKADYSGTPDYAARYSHGVLEFAEPRLELNENGPAGELKLIRRGGLEGEVSVRLKAIDVNARFGEDYTVTVEDAVFEQDPAYTGSLMDDYLKEQDIITAKTEDPEYLALVGYTEPEPLPADELASQRDQAINTAAGVLDVTAEQAAAMLTAEPKAQEKTENVRNESAPAAKADYASELHALHDEIVGKKTPANHSKVADVTDPDALLGDEDRNAAATAVNGKASGASIQVTFKAGENEKRVRVQPVDDDRYGAQKVIVLGLYDAQGGAELGEVFDANVVIRENEKPEKSTVGFAATAITVEHGALYAELQITRSGCVDDYAAVTVRTVAGTAREGVDYLPVDGGSTFLPGETAKTVAVPLKTALRDDDTDRTFTLRLESGSENAEVSRGEATVTIRAGKAAKPSAASAVLMADTPEPIVIKGDDLAQEALDRNIEEGNHTYASKLSGNNASMQTRCDTKVTVGGNRMNSLTAGGEINFTGIAKVEVVLEKNSSKGFALRLLGSQYSDFFDPDYGNMGAIVTSNDNTITLSYDFGYRKNYGKDYLSDWEKANHWGFEIVSAEWRRSFLSIDFKYSYHYSTKLWHLEMDDKTIVGPKIKEIRLYPIQIRLGVYAMDAATSLDKLMGIRSVYENGNKHPTSMTVQSSYQTYYGLDQPDKTISYTAGTASVPETVYVNDPIYYTLNPSDEGRRRGVYADGFYRFAPSYNTYTYRFTNNKGDKCDMGSTLWNTDSLPRFGYVNNLGSIYNKQYTVMPANKGVDYIAYLLSPVIARRDIDSVTIAGYDPNMGTLRIGGTVYNDVTLTRSRDGFTWTEGDELYVTAETKDGYYCDGIKVTRANGAVETVPAGQRVLLTNGMTIEPVFIQYNISLDLRWSELGTGIPEEKTANLEGYQIGYTYSGENEITFADHGDGSYTFGNLTPGKVLTLWAGPKEGQEKNRTGLWLLETEDERVRYDNGSYYLHVGDARAVTVDNKDMKMAYYLSPVDSVGGTVVSGQVCAKGIDIKHSTATKITAQNAEQTANFLPGVTVSAVCLDPNASATVHGKTYTTSAETDENGSFSVYVPGGAYGCGITLSLIRDDVYQVVSAPLLLGNGTLLIEMPAQNEHYQFDGVTLGQDTVTDEIYLTGSPVNLGLHLVIDEGYSVQNVRLTSYDENGNLLAEWFADPVEAGPWNYSSVFTPAEKLAPGGRLMAEVIDKNGKSMGKVDTGYWIKPEIKAADFVLPQFDPKQSVTLPVIGDVSIASDLGSDKAKPEEPEADQSTLSSGGKKAKTPIEIKYGFGSKIKTAIKELKLIDKKGYAEMSATQRASAIRAKLSELYGTGGTEKIAEGKMDNDAWFEHGSGKSAYKAGYTIGLYMSMYMDGMNFEFESLTLFASLTITGSTTQQYSISGVPVYLTLTSKTQVEGFVTARPTGGRDTVDMAGPDVLGWINDDLWEKTEKGGFFMFTVGVTIEAGVGHPSIVAGGIKGAMNFQVGYEPWDQGAAIVDLGLSAVLHLGPIELPYKITTASYGIFKTEGYQDSTILDFSKVKNADNFKQKSKSATLMSYDDGKMLTTVTAGYRQLSRPEHVDYGPQTIPFPRSDAAVLMAEGDNPGVRVNSLNTCTPVSLPLGEGKWLLLALYDVSKRAANDCSGLTWRILMQKADGSYEASDAVILDDDGTFDSNLTAVRLEDGRIAVVWSNAKQSWGDNPNADLGQMLNSNELRYCIFSADGVPGEVKTLSDQPGCEEVSRVAFDPKTGKTMIVYNVTDYQTEGISLNENNPENVGNFLYNSYCTTCFKLLDQNGEIITAYNPETESKYIEYETAHGQAGLLGGLRYLDAQLSDTQSQAKLDQFSVGAIDGKAYVVYALDTDRDTGTDGDRELFLVNYDLATMACAGPVCLTNNLKADVNPQLLNFMGNLLLFWSHEGSVSCVDITEADPQSNLMDQAEILFSDAAGAANYMVEEDPGSGLLWLCWCGSYDRAEDNGARTSRSAVFMRIYDRNFAYTDENGQALLDEEGNPITGAWGSIEPLLIAEADNLRYSELNVALPGGIPLLSFKQTTMGEDGEALEYLLNYCTVDFENAFVVDAELSPDYPMAEDEVTATVHAANYGALPAEKLTVLAELVHTSGETQDLGTREHNGHIRSAAVATEVFRFIMPEDPQNWSLKLTAYGDDAQKGVTKEIPLPCGPSATLDEISTEPLGENRYAVSLDVGNSGNRALTGAKLVLEKEPEDLLEENGAGTFVTLETVSLATVDAKEERHEYLPFDLPNDVADVDGAAVIWITVQSEDGTTLAKQEIRVRRQQQAKNPAAEKLTINGSETPADIVLRPNQTAALQTAVLPAEAGEGCAVTYRVEDPAVVTVDESGVLTAVGSGTTTVYADAYFPEDTLLIGADNRMSSRNGTITMDKNGILQYTAPEGAALHNSVRVAVSGGGSGAAASEPTYSATLTPLQQGEIAVSSMKPKHNEKVTVTVTPDEGYEVDTVTVKDASGREIPVTKNADGTYTYVQPDSNVTVSATFKAKANPDDPQTKKTFKDVPAGSYYEKAVDWAVAKDITTGTGEDTFSPNASCTRAQMVTFLWRAAGKPAPKTQMSPFADVKSGAYYYDAVLWAVENGVTKGTSATAFSPDAAVTRGQAVTFLQRAMKGTASGGNPFTDVAKSAFYYDAVLWAVANGITNGTSATTFSPDDACTRAQIVTFLYRAYAEK